jgi:hypothetical protein
MYWNWLALFVRVPGMADPLESLKNFMYSLHKIIWTRGAASAQLSDLLESLKNSTEPLPKSVSPRGSPAPQLEVIFKIKKKTNNQETSLSC